ncbi:MAG: hypothetical protein ACRDRS_20050 [Pseudonocardiaceae bacterium]
MLDVAPPALRRCGVMRRDELITMGAPEPAEALRAGGWLLEPGMPLETARQVTGLPDARLVELLLSAAPARELALTHGRVHLTGPVSGPVSGLPDAVRDAIAALRAELATRPFAAPEAHRLATSLSP